MTSPREIADSLTEHEARVLRTISGGPDEIGGWGAWVSAVMSSLRRLKLAKLAPNLGQFTLVPTDLGRAVAQELESGDG